MEFNILLYVFIGGLWSLWLEYFTTNNLEGKMGEPWSNFERIMQWVFWPIYFSVFIFNWIRFLIENWNNDDTWN